MFELKQYFLDIISTVGPDLSLNSLGPKGEDSNNLFLCYTNCLRKMKEEGLRSIAFPCISTAIYGYPNEDACQVALEAAPEQMLCNAMQDKVEVEEKQHAREYNDIIKMCLQQSTHHTMKKPP